MLPLDSERWERLKGPVGNTNVHHTIKAFLIILDSNLPIKELDKKADDLTTDAFEELDHQQTTYPSTAAAVPHLLAIASRLPNRSRCRLWEACGIMHSDSAGYVRQEDLSKWYDDSIDKVIPEITQFVIETELTSNEQYQAFSALANFLDELYVYYAFRSFDWIEFECVHCCTEFEGELEDGRFICARVGADSVAAKFQLEEVDVQQAITRPGFERYRHIVDPAMQGQQTAVLDWLSNRLGTFHCPKCDAESWPIEYGFRDG